MRLIALEDVMIAWTPNIPGWRNRRGVAPAGSIGVFEGHGHLDAFDLYPERRGSCDLD